MPFAESTKGNYNVDSKTSIGLVCIIVAFYVCAEISIATRITQLLTSEHSMPLSEATGYVTYFFLLLFVGRMFFTFVSFPNISSSRLLMISHAISILCLLGGLFIQPWLLVFCGLTMAPCYALNMDYIAHVYKSESPKVMAQAMSFTSLVVVLFHYLLGVLTDYSSVGKALLVSPILLVICFCALFLFDKKFVIKGE